MLNISIFRDQYEYKFVYEYDDEIFIHDLTSPLILNDESIFVVAILSRPANFDEIRINALSVDEAYIDFFEKTTKSKIVCSRKNSTTIHRLREKLDIEKEKIYLGFSGGFDSVAAKGILGESAELVSIDFGGAFSREEEFFKVFNPSTFGWNIRKTRKYAKKFNEGLDWRFMLAPVAACAISSKMNVISTGSIFEASPFWFSANNIKKFSKYSAFGMGPAISMINPVAALTEYSTTKIALATLGEELISKSLKSLASERSFKFYRKQVLLSLIRGESLPENKSTMHKFGSSLADDFLTLYLGWRVGWKWVAENYALLPVDFSFDINMKFVEKYSLNNLHSFCANGSGFLAEKYKLFDIEPFTDDDCSNHGKVCDFLKIK